MRLMLNPQRQRVDANRRANRVTTPEWEARVNSGNFRARGNDPRNDAFNRTASITKQMFIRNPGFSRITRGLRETACASGVWFLFRAYFARRDVRSATGKRRRILQNLVIHCFLPSPTACRRYLRKLYPSWCLVSGRSNLSLIIIRSRCFGLSAIRDKSRIESSS